MRREQLAAAGARHKRRGWREYLLAALAWTISLSPLTCWGLPRKSDEARLFGGPPDWEKTASVARERTAQLEARHAGADTDLNPLARGNRIVDLTADEAARAEILLRYRLYSRQPDEMITFRALQRMHPRALDFDPQLYQYGGAFIYSVGALIGAASLVGITHISSDVAVYLAHPEYFATFYVLGRVIALVSGGLALLAIARIARLLGGRAAGWFALLGAAFSPVMITMALESKPHMPSACLALWAIAAALEFQRRPQRKAALKLGCGAGLAAAAVPTGGAAAFLWPALLLSRRRRGDRNVPRRDGANLIIAGLLAILIYTATNPYVIYNSLFRPDRLGSNLSNSTAMYAGQARHLFDGLQRCLELLPECAGSVTVTLGALALLVFALFRKRGLLIAAAPALAMFIVAIALAAGKPAEFGRFLLLPATLLCISAGLAMGVIWGRARVAAILVLATAIFTGKAPAYVAAFINDLRGDAESRHVAADFLTTELSPNSAIAVIQEPAPYAIPPLDFAHTRILLLPPARPDPFDTAQLPPFLVYTADDERDYASAWWREYYTPRETFGNLRRPARITWADKLVFVLVRR